MWIARSWSPRVQNMLGILPQVNRAQQSSDRKTANQLSVQLELQADCFAGVWASQAVKVVYLNAVMKKKRLMQQKLWEMTVYKKRSQRLCGTG